MKVTDKCAVQGDQMVYISDFTPLKSAAPDDSRKHVRGLDVDFICVAYNIFSNVPQDIRQDLDNGREGTDIALEILEKLHAFGVRTIYLVPPILKGGARDYEAAQKVLEAVSF